MKTKNKQSAFTVVELMISTAVFSLVLMTIMAVIAQIGRMYYRGVTTARVQEATRSVVDRISQEIQYSADGIANAPRQINNAPEHVICVSGARYFWVDEQLTDGSSYGIWYDEDARLTTADNPCNGNNSAALSANPVSPPGTNARELLPTGSRVMYFSLQPIGSNLYTIRLRVMYWTGNIAELDSSGVDKNCRSGTFGGMQFCAVSDITTTVFKRLQ